MAHSCQVCGQYSPLTAYLGQRGPTIDPLMRYDELCQLINAQSPLVPFVVDLLYILLYDKLHKSTRRTVEFGHNGFS